MPQSDTPPELFFVEVKVADWPRSLRWYQNALGLSLVQSDPEHEFALLAAGSAQLGLKRGAGETLGEPVRLVFRVDDVTAARERLERQGMKVGPPKDNEKEGYREIRLLPPEGPPITLFQWLPGRP